MTPPAGRRTAAGVVVAALVLTACTAGGPARVTPLPAPPSTAVTTTSQVPPDRRGVELPSATGRTTTTAVVIGPGPVRLSGTVVGPAGPVPGAMVRVDRLVGDTVASTELIAVDGTWELAGVNGGRYRVRAWRPPDLAQVEPTQVFVPASGGTTVELKVDGYSGLYAAATVVPDPPVVDQATTLSVQVSSRSVDPTGVVRSVPQPAQRVELRPAVGWTVRSLVATVTDGTGRARWELSCRAPGRQTLSVVVGALSVLALELPPCAPPPPPPAPPPSTPPPSTPG